MHAAVVAPADHQTTRTALAPRLRSLVGSWPAPSGATCLALAVLLVSVSLAVADGLLANIVPYERDTTVFYYPLMRWVGQQLHQGQFPLWTPQVFGGYPIFADGEIGLAYPPALAAMSLLEPARAFVVLRLVHLWLAATGMFMLARAWRLPRSGAVIGGLVFSLGSFPQAQIHHENIIRTVAWLPLLLALVEHALQSVAWRPRLRWTLGAALALGLAGLSLHSQMLAIDLLVLGVYAVMRWGVGPLAPWPATSTAWLGRGLALARVCLAVVVVGSALAAVQIIPLVELAGFSPRGSGIPYSESAAYSLTPYGLAQVVFPFVFRAPGNLQWGLWTHWESYLYVGLVPLVLAALAVMCVRGREVLAWSVIGLLGVVLALGQYSPINLHYGLWLLPGLSGLRAPGRFTVMTILAAGMLAAYGLAWLESEAHRARQLLPHIIARPSRGVRGAVSGLGATWLLLVLLVPAVHASLLAFPDGARQLIEWAYLSLARDSYPLTASDVYGGLAWSTDVLNPHVAGALAGLAVLVAVLAVWVWRGPRVLRAWRGWSGVLVVGTALDLLLFGWAIHPRASLDRLGAEPASVTALSQVSSADGTPIRILASPVLNQVAADRLAPFAVAEANGYSSLQFTSHRDYVNRVLYADDTLLDLWNVRYVLDPARYGRLEQYGGVDYLTQQALLHGPAGGAQSEQKFALQLDSVAEMRFVSALMGAVQLVQDTPVANIELLDANGQVLATRQLVAGRDVMDWAWDLPHVREKIVHQRVEVAGNAFEGGGPDNQRVLSFGTLRFDVSGAVSARVSAILPQGELALYGAAAVAADGTRQQLFGRHKTKYQQVYADAEIRVLENTDAWPRAFIVGSARLSPTAGGSLNQMVHQPFWPRDEVVLAGDTGGFPVSGPPANGRAEIRSYTDNGVRVHTTSDGDGLLVLSDTYYPGWTASVDGKPAPLMRGDVLFRVVPVPAGDHEVEFRFEPQSVRVGFLISCLAFVVTLCGFYLTLRGHRLPRSPFRRPRPVQSRHA